MPHELSWQIVTSFHAEQVPARNTEGDTPGQEAVKNCITLSLRLVRQQRRELGRKVFIPFSVLFVVSIAAVESRPCSDCNAIVWPGEIARPFFCARWACCVVNVASLLNGYVAGIYGETAISSVPWGARSRHEFCQIIGVDALTLNDVPVCVERKTELGSFDMYGPALQGPLATNCKNRLQHMDARMRAATHLLRDWGLSSTMEFSTCRRAGR